MKKRIDYGVNSKFHFVREKFWDAVMGEEAAICPCCERHAQLYHRKINKGMVAQLKKLYNYTRSGEYVHASVLINKGVSGSCDLHKLAYWDMIEAKEKAPGGAATGYWRITKQGEKFLNGDIAVPREALVFNNTVIVFGGEPVTIFGI